MSKSLVSFLCGLIRLAPTCEWDIAAADIIVREAGGVVLQAGAQDAKGNPLQDWKVGALAWGQAGRGRKDWVGGRVGEASGVLVAGPGKGVGTGVGAL
jgi:hypothetical protein